MFIMVPWGFAHWEEYHDGTMLYGNGVWGITEANYALVILHFITVLVRLRPACSMADVAGCGGSLSAALLGTH